MKRFTNMFAAIGLGLMMAGSAHARQDELDVSRLNSSLDQLANDPTMGSYAQAEQARARDAINRLAQASSRDRPHDLYLAERRVDLAKTAAQYQNAEVKISQLDREHDQILLANSQREADKARQELERQRLQYQLQQEETARLQQQGLEYSEAADQARADAERANKLAAAQSRVARAAKHQAALASDAARAMRSQMNEDKSPAQAAPAKPKKSAGKKSDGGP
ncbi:MAG: hypothetical protein ABI767_07030 [Rhodanobacter sp.]